MLGRQSVRNRPWCTPQTFSLALILVLVGVCLLEYLALQQKGKQIAQLTADVVAAGKLHYHHC